MNTCSANTLSIGASNTGFSHHNNTPAHHGARQNNRLSNSSKGSEGDLNRLGSFLGVMAQANADQGSDVVPPDADRRTAAVLGQRVAGLAGRWAAANAA